MKLANITCHDSQLDETILEQTQHFKLFGRVGSSHNRATYLIVLLSTPVLVVVVVVGGEGSLFKFQEVILGFNL